MRLKHRLVPTTIGVACLVLLIFASWFFFLPYRDVDILIVNGTLVDGEGSPPRICDVAIRDGRVVALGRWRFPFAHPKLRIDARNKIVAPGFIDVHTHAEPNLPTSGSFRPSNFLRQGVTTLITGNCGRSRTDIAGLFKALGKNGSYINLATLIGHNTVRKEVMGSTARRPTSAELDRMQQLVDRAMDDGALGLSTGL